MLRFIFLPLIFFLSILRLFSAEVYFSDKADHYKIKIEDIGEIAASATAVFSADGKNFRIGTKGLSFDGNVKTCSTKTPFGRAIQMDRLYGKKRRTLSAHASNQNFE